MPFPNLNNSDFSTNSVSMVIGRDRLTKGGGQRGRGETRRCARGAAGEQEAVRGGGGRGAVRPGRRQRSQHHHLILPYGCPCRAGAARQPAATQTADDPKP